jgi:hypothetical protein
MIKTLETQKNIHYIPIIKDLKYNSNDYKKVYVGWAWEQVHLLGGEEI